MKTTNKEGKCKFIANKCSSIKRVCHFAWQTRILIFLKSHAQNPGSHLFITLSSLKCCDTCPIIDNFCALSTHDPIPCNSFSMDHFPSTSTHQSYSPSCHMSGITPFFWVIRRGIKWSPSHPHPLQSRRHKKSNEPYVNFSQLFIHVLPHVLTNTKYQQLKQE